MITERTVQVFGLTVALLFDSDTLDFSAVVGSEKGSYIGHGATWKDAVDEAIDSFIEAESEVHHARHSGVSV